MRKQRFTAVLQMLAAFAVLGPLASGESKAGWVNIGLNQSFEGTFPAGKWIVYDCSHTATQGIWSKTTSKPYVGTFSAHVRGGTTPYNYNTCTWMRFGPFGVNAGATDARMVFNYWLDSEVGYDFFRWEYSCDGVAGEWTGQAMSGNVGTWKAEILSLKPCVGKTQVYIQFFFQSDPSVNYQGVWVDNVRVQQFFP